MKYLHNLGIKIVGQLFIRRYCQLHNQSTKKETKLSLVLDHATEVKLAN